MWVSGVCTVHGGVLGCACRLVSALPRVSVGGSALRWMLSENAFAVHPRGALSQVCLVVTGLPLFDVMFV
jgi:hypothetical protein